MNLEWAALTAAGVLLLAVLRATVPILFAALGGLLSEMAGCINVALEGMMLVSAFFGVIGAIHAPHWFPHAAPWLLPWIGALCGLCAALVLAAALSWLHLECGADLIVAGIALNLLAGGLTVFLLAELVGDKGSTASIASPALPSLRIPGLAPWPLLDLLLNGEGGRGHHVLLYGAAACCALLWFFLVHTRAGRWLRAAGENPEAARAAGIPVKRLRHGAILASGLLAGLGGLYLSMGYLTLFQADMTAGRGFLALAAVFLGARRLRGVLAAALLFGAAAVAVTRLGAYPLPPQLVFMLPPAVTLLALAVFGWRAQRRRLPSTEKEVP